MAIEKTTTYATVVDDLPSAFAFIMGKIDVVGEAPSVIINPIWVYSSSEDGTRRFEVSVSGMVEEDAD